MESLEVINFMATVGIAHSNGPPNTWEQMSQKHLDCCATTASWDRLGNMAVRFTAAANEGSLHRHTYRARLSIYVGAVDYKSQTAAVNTRMTEKMF